MRSTFLAAAAVLAATAPLHSQQLLRTFPGSAPGDALGVTVVATGDLDGDGRPDLATGAPYAYSGLVDAGAVQAWSSTGVELFRADGLVEDEQFGKALDVAGDVDGDGLDDLIAGGEAGFARLVSGADGAFLRTWSGPAGSFGTRVAGPGDMDGDGTPDVVVASPFVGDYTVRAFSGASGALLHAWSGPTNGYGATVSRAGDLDGDGRADVLIADAQTGRVHAFSGATGALLFTLQPPPDSFAFGFDLDGGRDVDLDGVPDVLVGDPFFPTFTSSLGRVHLFSGATQAQLWSFTGSDLFADVGGEVAFLGDLDLDGRPDVAVGPAGLAFSSNSRGPQVLSGASGTTIARLKDHESFFPSSLGEALAGAADLDGDGRSELLVAAPGAQGGRGEVRAYSFACDSVATYCTGKTSSSGCVPRLDWGGVTQASATAPFLVRGLLLPSQALATLFYSTAGPASTPFQGGTLCVQPPTARTTAQFSGGSSGTCTGSVLIDFNAWIAGGSDPALVPGVQVWGQVWGRDSADPFGSALTDAIAFHVCP